MEWLARLFGTPVEDAVIEVILASLHDRPWEWAAQPFRVSNEARDFSIWCRSKGHLAYADGLKATWADGKPIPRRRRQEVWDAIQRLAAMQTVRRFQDDG